MGTREWSRFQTAIFDDVATGQGNTVVQARAGTGKTTVIEEACNRVPRDESIQYVVFNKRNADEAKGRMPSRVAVSTCHSYGLRIITKALGRRAVETNKVYMMLREYYANAPKFPFEHARIVRKLVSLAKGSLLSDERELDDCIDNFGLLDDGPTWRKGTKKQVDPVAEANRRREVIGDALRVLDASKQDKWLEMVDFDDMIWLPHALNLPAITFDRVFIDELQDYSAAQVELALRACSTFGGRICGVGDDKQAVYGFRGADQYAMRNVIQKISAKVLPLSITYRCPKAVVRLAQEIVPDYEAHESAPEGAVTHASEDRMKQQVQAGDFVLSRINAPLIGLCLGLLKQGRRAMVRGKDIGTNLANIVKRSEQTSVPDLSAYMQAWRMAERSRLLSKDPPNEGAMALVDDKAECIEALCEGATQVAEVLDRIERLFTDMDDRSAVVFSTVHKAKGLEAPKVWLLANTFHRGASVEEDNVFYVAVTRAQQELVLVERGAA
jgi:DNA helicase II / ATP-dependent DNA helicase PcrA